MGNCCSGHKSSMVCAGDDYEEFESMGAASNEQPNTENQRLLGIHAINRACSSSSSFSSSSREVKIKMTKKQLEELLTKGDVHGIPVDQLLQSLINHHDRFDTTQELQGQWMPTLQSIPEAD